MPGGAKQSGVTAREVEMAQSLVESMSAEWNPDDFHDTYRDDVLALVRKKIKSRQTHSVAEPDDDGADTGRSSAQVIDLMALLKKSIAGKSAPSRASAAPKRKSAAKPAAKSAAKPAHAPAARKSARGASAGRHLRSA